MGLSSPADWDRFMRVNVDLADIFGTPGFPQAVAVAEQMSSAFATKVTQSTEAPGLFLVGEFADVLLGSPETKVNGFLGRMDAAMPNVQVQPDNVKVVARQESLTGMHIVGQQTLRGAEVVGARFRLHLERNRPYAFTGRPVGDLPGRDPGEPPTTRDRDAIDAIREHFQLAREQRIAVERVIFPIPGVCVWAWQGRFVLYEPVADIRAYVRADDFSLLLSFNAAAAALRGEARVYPINPLRTPQLETVRLDHIGPVPTDRLTGPFVSVKPRTGVAFSQSLRDCRLDPADPAFDEAHAFYHLSRAVQYFQGVLEGGLLDAAPFAPIKAIVRDPQSPNNAFFVPSTGELLFGDFGTRPSARSAEIIFHEFAHAVSDAICRLGRAPLNSLARALSEGYSDYFAASALNDPRVGDYVANLPNGARNCAQPGLRFPVNYVGLEHELGEVWAAVLWGIRGQCGVGVTDALAIESLQHLDPQSTFEHARAALIIVDQQLFPEPHGRGRHEDIIDNEFNKRNPV